MKIRSTCFGRHIIRIIWRIYNIFFLRNTSTFDDLFLSRLAKELILAHDAFTNSKHTFAHSGGQLLNVVANN